jgi:7-cyano-7-deazaguanine synthase in queuosine biosynthesis
MSALAYAAYEATEHLVDAITTKEVARRGALVARIGENIHLTTNGLESYFFAESNPVLLDLLIVAAAIEYCDIVFRRPAWGWTRRFNVRIAVHDDELWNASSRKSALEDAASFLTGDAWSFSFVRRKHPSEPIRQNSLKLDPQASVIMPYSDGLDSRAVAAIVEAKEGAHLVRVRLGTKGADKKNGKPFTAVPYEVRVTQAERRESSARSRGFKFAVITGIAAHLANVKEIIVTESGQGALGPVLTVTGHAYPDYRVHPAFTKRMELLFKELANSQIKYMFPRLWSTKGETLAEANALGSFKWHDTRSCWQQSRQVAVDGKRRQCGVCAACMLRRMSMHTAELQEEPSTYVWENLSASTIRAGAAKNFNLFTEKLEQYAIAGVLHMDHLAALTDSSAHALTKQRISREIAYATNTNPIETSKKLNELLQRHQKEWKDFLKFLGATSFVSKIALAGHE